MGSIHDTAEGSYNPKLGDKLVGATYSITGDNKTVQYLVIDKALTNEEVLALNPDWAVEDNYTVYKGSKGMFFHSIGDMQFIPEGSEIYMWQLNNATPAQQIVLV